MELTTPTAWKLLDALLDPRPKMVDDTRLILRLLRKKK